MTYHALHRMTANLHCVDCGASETDLYERGASISGFDEHYEPEPLGK